MNTTKNMTQAKFFFNQQTPHNVIEEGITRQVMGHSEHITLARVTFATGASAQIHAHEAHEQSSYIDSGRFEITLGDQTMMLDAGDGFFIPRGVAHNATCIEQGVLIDTFSPGRTDMTPQE